MFLAKIRITLKPTVNDPQGQTISSGLNSLGFQSVDSVRAGKYLEVRVSGDKREQVEKDIQQMCDKLLANPVIEEYHYELEEIAPSPFPSPIKGEGKALFL